MQQQHDVSCEAKIHSEIFSEDPTTIRVLPHFLAEFQRLNPGTFTELQRYESGDFRRAMIILSPSQFVSGQNLYGVDAAHIKHRKYNGAQLVMVGRDENLNNRIAAVALAPVEDHDNYHWFFDRIKAHGFPISDVPMFSDRHKGIVSAAADLTIFNLYCVRHIIGNMRSDKDVKLAVSQEKFVWAANAATTSMEFEKALRRTQLAEKWDREQRQTIPRGENKFQLELKKSVSYWVEFSSATLAFVSPFASPLKQRRVELNVKGPTCSCAEWLQHGVSCRHIIAMCKAVRGKDDDAVATFMDDCYKVRSHKVGLVPLEIPDETILQVDATLLPATFYRQAGHPRKRRIRSRGDSGRVRKLYKCSKCGKTDRPNTLG